MECNTPPIEQWDYNSFNVTPEISDDEELPYQTLNAAIKKLSLSTDNDLDQRQKVVDYPFDDLRKQCNELLEQIPQLENLLETDDSEDTFLDCLSFHHDIVHRVIT